MLLMSPKIARTIRPGCLFGMRMAVLATPCHEQTRSMLDEHKGKGNSKRFETGAKQSFDGKCCVKLDNGLLGVGPNTTRAAVEAEKQSEGEGRIA